MEGKVYLVGAGPGDYKLMTLRGLECIQKADVIVYDRLANEDYLKEAKAGCEIIYVGKAGSHHTLPQDEINALIVEKAKEGKWVTRLKGGDPYVFGRGGEEAEYLLEQGLSFETVPGITSAIGGLCYAGIPITHRDYASSFHVITGHLRDGAEEEIPFEALAKLRGTLVFLMGVSNLKTITEKLLAAGKKETTPVALVSWATRPRQCVVVGNLKDIYEKALEEEVKPPTLIVVGEVVHLREKLNFFEERPLFGKTIMVTRSREQSSHLVMKLQDQGASVLECPTITIQKNEEDTSPIWEELDSYTYLVFTSPNGVKYFFETLHQRGKDARSLSNMQIWAVGQGTADALKMQGIRADGIPPKAIAESLYESLKEHLKPEDRILLPQSQIARDYLSEALKKHAHVTEIKLYTTLKPEGLSESYQAALEKGEVDYITFTSSSTCQYFVELMGQENLDKLKDTKLISIGPITSKTIQSYGLKVYKEAAEHTLNALVDTIVQDSLLKSKDKE
ncbi:uroporphyrinogen-III C-methyltransferase [Sporanaerobium hydrogeniformans]|uniref:Uroporphyrinogen-III C-methyltransferase n=1 Tax=Sporanaerobium hydrogeniformans TaxID=3072179 RepID=A0AC61DCE5_9FIRM|nr:uroporphyrinogen-III C-methyltransferase [Sporanaerobium hydrogeniformans]PHV70984.1 uroporphyrinogen-III C-methyltransferase [Sporanaerobium hydrogeniformans]